MSMWQAPKRKTPHVDVDVAAAKEKFQKTKLKLVHKNWMTKTHSLMLDSFWLGIVSNLNIFRFLWNSDTTSLFWQSSFFNWLFSLWNWTVSMSPLFWSQILTVWWESYHLLFYFWHICRNWNKTLFFWSLLLDLEVLKQWWSIEERAYCRQ